MYYVFKQHGGPFILVIIGFPSTLPPWNNFLKCLYDVYQKVIMEHIYFEGYYNL